MEGGDAKLYIVTGVQLHKAEGESAGYLEQVREDRFRQAETGPGTCTATYEGG